MKKALRKISIFLIAALIMTSTPVMSFASTLDQGGGVSESNGEDSKEDGAEAHVSSEEEKAEAEVSTEEEAEVKSEEPSESAEAPAAEEAPSEAAEEAPSEAAEEAPSEAAAEETAPGEEAAPTESAKEEAVAETPAETEDTETAPEAEPEDCGVIVLEEGETPESLEGETASEEDEDEEKKEKDEDEEEEEDKDKDEKSEEEEEEGISFVPGNIDMNMDFSDETLAEITRATTETQTGQYTEDGEFALASDDEMELPGSYYDSLDYVFDPKPYGETAWCWAYTAASLAVTNILKNAKAKKDNDAYFKKMLDRLTDKEPKIAEHIVVTSYNPGRYDYYGETWDRATNVTDFDEEKVGERRDYTSYIHLTTPISSEDLEKERIGKITKTKETEIRTEKRNNRKDFIKKYIDKTDLKHAYGNLISTVFNFERWAAPNSEGVYNFEGNTETIDAQLENAVWVPNTDIDSIKRLIRDYGSAGIQVKLVSENSADERDKIRQTDADPGKFSKKDLNEKYCRYFKYAPSYTGYTTNHTVALIAWDDNISEANFSFGEGENKQTPKKSGAFLAKCSGKNESAPKYFWISYDDAAFKLYNGSYKYAVAYDFAPFDKNDYTYGYDGTNHYDTYYIRKTFGIFKSSHSGKTGSGNVEMIKSVGIGVQDAGKYKISIYYGYDPNATTDKQYLNLHEVETVTTEISDPGYHTVELEEPILFYKNDVISVCLEKEDGSNFSMLVDGFYDEYSYNNEKNKKEHDTTPTYEEQIKNDKGEVIGEIIYHSFSHSSKSTVESYFGLSTDSSTANKVLSCNGIPVTGDNAKGSISTRYMSLTPRLRLYTSDVKVPKNIDQTMLDVKLQKYIWVNNGSKEGVTPDPVVMVDFTKTNPSKPKDNGGREYRNAVIMYNHYEAPDKNKVTVPTSKNVGYANNKTNGIAAAIIKGKGDIFSGEISVPFKIVSGKVNIGKCKILGLEPQDYRELEGRTLTNTYEDIKKKIIVKYYVSETKHYVTLQEGVDYKLGSIEGENKYGKKLSVMITGIGTFTNTIKPTFKIRKAKAKRPLSDADIKIKLSYTDKGEKKEWEEGEIPEFVYTGKKIKPEIEEVIDVKTGHKLEAGVDYKAKISYKGNKKTGMASVVISAAKGGSYSGKTSRYYFIAPIHINTDAKVNYVKEYTYTGNPIKALPKVTLYGTKLKKSDIYVAYENNTGSSSGEATAKGTVFGKGRYTGYIGYDTFTIKPKSSTTK